MNMRPLAEIDTTGAMIDEINLDPEARLKHLAQLLDCDRLFPEEKYSTARTGKTGIIHAYREGMIPHSLQSQAIHLMPRTHPNHSNEVTEDRFFYLQIGRIFQALMDASKGKAKLEVTELVFPDGYSLHAAITEATLKAKERQATLER